MAHLRYCCCTTARHALIHTVPFCCTVLGRFTPSLFIIAHPPPGFSLPARKIRVRNESMRTVPGLDGPPHMYEYRASMAYIVTSQGHTKFEIYGSSSNIMRQNRVQHLHTKRCSFRTHDSPGVTDRVAVARRLLPKENIQYCIYLSCR